MLMEGGAAAPAVAAVPGATPLHLVVGNLGDSDAALLTHPETGERSPGDHPEIGERPWRLVDHLVSTRHRPEERSEEDTRSSYEDFLRMRGGRVGPIWANHSHAERTANLQLHRSNQQPTPDAGDNGRADRRVDR